MRTSLVLCTLVSAALLTGCDDGAPPAPTTCTVAAALTATPSLAHRRARPDEVVAPGERKFHPSTAEAPHPGADTREPPTCPANAGDPNASLTNPGTVAENGPTAVVNSGATDTPGTAAPGTAAETPNATDTNDPHAGDSSSNAGAGTGSSDSSGADSSGDSGDSQSE